MQVDWTKRRAFMTGLTSAVAWPTLLAARAVRKARKADG
jgi:hypothetical protein